MDKFPECAGKSVIDNAGEAAAVLNDLNKQLLRILPDPVNPVWDDETQGKVRSWTLETRVTLERFAIRSGSRKNQARETMRALSPGGATLSEGHEKGNAESWILLRKYFNGVTHHTYEQLLDLEFRTKVAELEDMMGAMLVPTPTDDMDAIDRLIREAELGDKD